MGNIAFLTFRLVAMALIIGLLASGCSAGGPPHPEDALVREAVSKPLGADVVLKDLSVSWSDSKDKGESKLAPFKARFEVNKDLYAQDTDYHDKELRRRGLPVTLSSVRGWNADGKHQRPAFFTLLNPKGASVTAYGKVAYQRQVDRWLVEAGEFDLGETKTTSTGFMGLDGASLGHEMPSSAKGVMGNEVPAYRVDSPEAKAYFDAVEQKVKELQR